MAAFFGSLFSFFQGKKASCVNGQWYATDSMGYTFKCSKSMAMSYRAK